MRDRDIDTYIDGIECLAERLSSALNRGEKSDFVQTLGQITDMLRSVSAEGLTEGANALLRAANGGDWDECGKKLGAFIASLLSLSIDIQIARYESENGPVISAYVKGACGERKTVLSVDDRPEILTTVSAALSRRYKVLAAPSGHVALRIIGQHRVDLFILDIEMPGMDGFELTERIRATEGYKDTPIIYLTATSCRERVMRAMRLGVRDFAVKPACNEALLAKADKFLA
jgi:CheY-like chemotaxis protein